MSTLAQHLARVEFDLGDGLEPFAVTDVTVTIDEERAPYISADITLPFVPGLQWLDPTDRVLWGNVVLTRRRSRVDKIRDLTRRYRDKLLSFITGLFQGDEVEDLTESLHHDYDGVTPPRPDYVRTFRLTLRSVSIDYAADVMRMTMTSGEAVLMDHSLMDTGGRRVDGATLAAKVDELLSLSGGVLVDPPTGTPADSAIGDEAQWGTGQTAWDCAQAMTRTHRYQLWCDDAGEFHLARTRTAPAAFALYAGSGPSRSITNVTEERTRDDGWANAVLVEHRFDDGSAYDVAVQNVGWPHKLRRIEIERGGNLRPITTGRAQATLDTIAGRHLALEVLAVNDYTLNPGGSAVIDTPRTKREGHVTSIRWQLPQDQMSIRLRDAREVA